MCELLEKDAPFNFSENFLHAFQTLKEKLVYAPILVHSNWSLPFELICDANDHAIRACLGQRRDKKLHVIYYASRTLTEAQTNYATIENELLLVVFTFDKFCSYLIGMKVIVYMDHVATKFLLAKKMSSQD